MCVCVCVFFPFILDIKFVGRTCRGHTGGRSRRISHPPSFCCACLNFSREKDSAIPFPRRPWSRILCTNDLIVLPPLGILISFFSFSVRKIPFAGIELTSQRVRGYMVPLSYRVPTCVCVFSSHSFWTSSSLDVPAGAKQEEGLTGFFIHLLSAVRAFIFLARRIQPFLSLVDREVEFCV